MLTLKLFLYAQIGLKKDIGHDERGSKTSKHRLLKLPEKDLFRWVSGLSGANPLSVFASSQRCTNCATGSHF